MPKQLVRRLAIPFALILLVAGAFALTGRSVLAQDAGSSIKLMESSVTSEFPEGYRIKVAAEAENEIKQIAVRMKIGQRTREVYEYMGDEGGEASGGRGRTLELTPGKSVRAELFRWTNSTSNYIPPGTIITYNFDIEDMEGNQHKTEPEEFVYTDVRYEWKEVTDGLVTVAYHGPVEKRARDVLDTAKRTIDLISPIYGAVHEDPIRVSMYNNAAELVDAYPPRYGAIGHGVIVDGQAHTQEGLVMIEAGGRDALGTTSHEITHIIIHRATFNPRVQNMPSWLNEGLAEFGNLHATIGYDLALEFAVQNDRVLPIMFMRGQPSKGEDIIIFYGQARSIVRWLFRTYGRDTLTEFLSYLRQGNSLDRAFTRAYGGDRIEITNRWREEIGTTLYEPPSDEIVKPTPVPQRTLGLYSLTPQAGVQTVGSGQADEPTATPEPTPTPQPTPEPLALAPASEPEKGDEEEELAPAAGSGCFAPAQSSGVLDLTGVAVVAGLAFLGVRRRVWPFGP
ncbi:MAG: peptidase MA family metallohydrolase [Chloroflexi bacterium]|nr:peptidase MA family metallohydrolase [Chloroflexota bacterium]